MTLEQIKEAAFKRELIKIAEQAGLTTSEVLASGLGGPVVYPFMAADKAKSGHGLSTYLANAVTTGAGNGLGMAAGAGLGGYLLRNKNPLITLLGAIAGAAAGAAAGSIGGAAVGKRLTYGNMKSHMAGDN